MRNRISFFQAAALAAVCALTLGPSGGCPIPGGDGGLNSRSLDLDITGEGSVTLTPPGTTYGPDDTPASDSYSTNTTVTLTATADPGWEFYHWSGDLTGNTNPATLVMASDAQVTAIFLPEGIAENLTPVNAGSPGTWVGFIAAEHMVDSEDSGQCQADSRPGTVTFEVQEEESAKAAVSVGPVMDLAWQMKAEGTLEAIMDNSYHTVTRYNSEECCQDPPDCDHYTTVSPGDVFDYLNTLEAEDNVSLATDAASLHFEVFIGIMPAGIDESDGMEIALAMAHWITPYEDARIPINISISITPNEDVEYTEANDDYVTDACEGSTDHNTSSSVAGTFDASMDFTFEGVLIKRSDGAHEIIGFYSENWSEEGHSEPCGAKATRNVSENCTLHLIRRP